VLKALSVTQLSTYITNIFDAEEMLHDIKVYGEVSNYSFKYGNVFFNLKDENALVPCVMFGVSANNIKEGDQILATGSMRYYGKGGKVNFYVTAVMPYGSGMLYQKFLELKNKLEAEGLFDSSLKKSLPKNISTVGVITSITGAVVHDIEKVAHRRNPILNIVVYPARVQGDGAEKTIIKGLNTLDQMPEIDVIIIARGGGSIEDLQCFNTESLARAIVATTKPVVSAVGHETDFTICDFASSLRAATPSEAGELVAQNVLSGLDKFKDTLDKIFMLENHILEDKFNSFDRNFVNLDNRYEKLFAKKIGIAQKNVIKLRAINFVDKVETNLSIAQNKVFSVNPVLPLERGYARMSKGGKVLKSAKTVAKDDVVCAEFLDGKIESVVKNIREVKNDI
jgi:exodeoxyribonuclease VII large subunit